MKTLRQSLHLGFLAVSFLVLFLFTHEGRAQEGFPIPTPTPFNHVEEPQAPAPDIKICDSYLNKKRELGCTNRNYLIQFGYRYCRAFVEINDQFTNHGQWVAKRIRECLIQELEANDKLSCHNVRALSVKTHNRCYVQAGFCELTVYDQVLIFNEVWPELFNTRILDAALDTAAVCVGI